MNSGAIIPVLKKKPLRRSVYFWMLLMMIAVAGTASALLPTLLTEAPRLMLAMNPNGRNIVLLVPLAPASVIFGIALARRLFSSVIFFGLGQEYADEILDWAKKRSPEFDELISTVESVFVRYGFVILYFVPASLVCTLAAKVRMRFPVFLAITIAGHLTWISLFYFAGAALADQVTILITFARRYVLPLTIVCIILVIGTQGRRWLGAGKSGRRPRG